MLKKQLNKKQKFILKTIKFQKKTINNMNKLRFKIKIFIIKYNKERQTYKYNKMKIKN